jgi:hypothetical protein
MMVKAEDIMEALVSDITAWKIRDSTHDDRREE